MISSALSLCRGTSNDVFNVMGALFICITFLGTSNASGVQPVVSLERPVFYRERAAGMYAVGPFALSQGLVELPYILVQSILYGVVTYFLIRFEFSAAKFFWYLLFTYLTLTFFTFYGMMAVAISPALHLATIMSSMFYSIWFIFAGFFIPYKVRLHPVVVDQQLLQLALLTTNRCYKHSKGPA